MENKKNIYQKIYNLKTKVGKLPKTETNPFYKSKYFDINQVVEALEPLLQENKLILLQPIEDHQVISKIIDIESGETVSSSLPLSDYKDPQKTGSEITYYRRYTLQSLLGLQAADDDANGASQTDANQKKQKTSITQWLNEKDYKQVIQSTDIKYLTEFGLEWSTAPKGMKAEYRDGIKSRIKELKPQKS
jgi:hypothetical protein